MLKTITTALLSLVCLMQTFASDYDDAWKAIGKKDFKTAKELLLKAARDPAKSLDAYLTLLYIQTYQGREKKLEGFAEALSASPDKSAYLFATWFNGAVLGGYGKKQAYQFALLNKILSDNTMHGSLQSAAHYVKALHYFFSTDFSKARQEWTAMGAIGDWQLTGPFDNLSGSGFNNHNGPITTASATATFKAANNVEVSWFTPPSLNREGWIFTYPHLPYRTAVIYAQTFVNAPEDMKVLLNAGGNGSLKIWVNDGLVLSEAKERVTELDYYKNYCTLKKGYNRILVQLGYTGNSRPNFIVRLTDDQFLPVKGLTATAQVQPYPQGGNAATTTSARHFAEAFFEKKIAGEPQNLLNYILLSQTYLRDERTTEARQTIEKALLLSPNNALLKFELVQTLLKADNRTRLMQEVEWMKENDKESYLNYQLTIENLVQEEKYSEADEALAKMKSLYGEDEPMVQMQIGILGKQQKVEEFLKLIPVAYNNYPDNVNFLSMMFRMKKQVMKDAKGALNVYEKYLKDNFNYTVLTDLADEYKEQGLPNKYLAILKQLYELDGSDPMYANKLSNYYFQQQNYAKALDYAGQALKLSPFTGAYWYNLASIQEVMKKNDDAIASLRKTIYYDRTNYDARKKLSELENKTPLYKLLPEDDAYAVIKKAPAESKDDFTYLLDEKSTIIYDEGASEEYIHYAVKIHTQKGIDTWKETYLGYDDNNQTLLVEKCEVVKSSGAKVPAERNGSEVVFTGLETGDAIHIKYRKQNYYSGRMGKEFFDKFNFNAFVPSQSAKYTLIVPENYQFLSQVVNGKMEPVTKETDGYKIFTWAQSNMPALKAETFMPPLNDVGTVLHISTLKTWADVANWYSDLSYKDNTNNYELEAAYDAIFSNSRVTGNYRKARLIYEYILSNIRYSSVPFRQSGLVPQDVTQTLSTRLGDCKDLSTLFVALAAKAGIPAQLVLIDTRDNGSKDMVLPSMEFNHCIVLIKIDGKDYYLELTDNDLPFGSLPNNLNGALSLVIPPHGQKSSETLKPLVATNRAQDKIVRKVDVTINGKDENVAVELKYTGHLTSALRSHYATISEEKQREDFEQSISNKYKNPIKLESLSFESIQTLSDSLLTRYAYTVKNEVIEAGSMKMVKIPFIDIIATVDNFSADKRDFPIEYWKYENTDVYETIVTMQAPAGQKLMEIPENQSLSFQNSTYSITYIREGEKLKIIRKAKLQRENIAPSDYAAFKKFFTDIVEAESKYIVFK